MKTMTYKQMGGACDETFGAETFEQMAELSEQHALLIVGLCLWLPSATLFCR